MSYRNPNYHKEYYQKNRKTLLTYQKEYDAKKKQGSN